MGELYITCFVTQVNIDQWCSWDTKKGPVVMLIKSYAESRKGDPRTDFQSTNQGQEDGGRWFQVEGYVPAEKEF